MNVKVINTEACVIIDGVKYRHHLNGGGLVAEGLNIQKDVRIDISCIMSEAEEVLIHRFLVALEEARKVFPSNLVIKVENVFRRHIDKSLFISQASEAIEIKKKTGNWPNFTVSFRAREGSRAGIGPKSMEIIEWALNKMQKRKPFLLRWKK